MIEKDQTFTFRLKPRDLKALNNLRKQEDDLPSKSEMLRRLIERTSGYTSEPRKHGGRRAGAGRPKVNEAAA